MWIHTHLSTTFNLTLNCSLIFTHTRRSDQYCRAYPGLTTWISVTIIISWQSSTRVYHWVMSLTTLFLAHLSTKWAIVTGLCPSSSVVRCASCVNFFTYTSSPLKPLIGFWPNFTGMIPRCSSTKVVQTVPLGCISKSPGQKIGFQTTIFKNLLVWNYKALSFIFSI